MSELSEIEKIASKHLGKAGDGTVVKPYVTPDFVDASLLVGVPRILNRTGYNIDEDNLPFVGVDSWNAYEFSTLLTNGFPVSGWLKFSYSSDTPNIVESKSAKLYLNSYNMVQLIDTIDQVSELEEAISFDLSTIVGGLVEVSLHLGDVLTFKPFTVDFAPLEDNCDVEQMTFSSYNEDPSILKVTSSSSEYYAWSSHSLRSNCRVTHQPDWGDVYVYIKGDKTVTPESLLQYIVSMRNEFHFHEEINECVYKRLYDLLEPEELFVSCLYARRGGLDINPTRASTMEVLTCIGSPIIDACTPCTKTSKQ
jgi:7-cyano-7-deazaguanine reductase